MIKNHSLWERVLNNVKDDRVLDKACFAHAQKHLNCNDCGEREHRARQMGIRAGPRSLLENRLDCPNNTPAAIRAIEQVLLQANRLSAVAGVYETPNNYWPRDSYDHAFVTFEDLQALRAADILMSKIKEKVPEDDDDEPPPLVSFEKNGPPPLVRETPLSKGDEIVAKIRYYNGLTEKKLDSQKKDDDQYGDMPGLEPAEEEEEDVPPPLEAAPSEQRISALAQRENDRYHAEQEKVDLLYNLVECMRLYPGVDQSLVVLAGFHCKSALFEFIMEDEEDKEERLMRRVKLAGKLAEKYLKMGKKE